jgi:transcriptional regulator with XRE-family HTH domain
MDEGVGDALRRTREQNGLSLAVVAAHLGVCSSDLADIEKGLLDRLGETRARGYVRLYARFLGHDAEGILLGRPAGRGRSGAPASELAAQRSRPPSSPDPSSPASSRGTTSARSGMRGPRAAVRRPEEVFREEDRRLVLEQRPEGRRAVSLILAATAVASALAGVAALRPAAAPEIILEPAPAPGDSSGQGSPKPPAVPSPTPTPTRTPTPAPAPAPTSSPTAPATGVLENDGLVVQVLDGARNEARYAAMRAYLEQLGYTVHANGGTRRAYQATTIVFAPGMEEAAHRLATFDERFTVVDPNIHGFHAAVDLHVVVGADWKMEADGVVDGAVEADGNGQGAG